MRKILRIILIIIVILAGAAAATWGISQWLSRRQTQEALARQAEAIAAHRQAQRTETPVP